MFLMLAIKKPTSPAFKLSVFVLLGVKIPTSSTRCSFLFEKILIFVLGFISPSMTLIKETTPR